MLYHNLRVTRTDFRNGRYLTVYRHADETWYYFFY